MKFEEAFNDVIEEMQKKQPENVKFVVSPNTAKILALMWSMLAVSKNVLDDLAYIDNTNDIISIPIPDKKSTDNKKEKKTGQEKKIKPDVSVDENVKEKQEETKQQ